MRRRLILKLSLGAAASFVSMPLRVLAAWNTAAFSATSEADAIAKFFGDGSISPTDDIEISMHDRVENGAVVPIQVRTTLPDPESITIFAERNPNPLIAHFALGPGCRGFIATRIKLGAPSEVAVVVRSRERLFSTRKFVEVVEGGCN